MAAEESMKEGISEWLVLPANCCPDWLFCCLTSRPPIPHDGRGGGGGQQLCLPLGLRGLPFALERPKGTSHAVPFSVTPPDQTHPTPLWIFNTNLAALAIMYPKSRREDPSMASGLSAPPPPPCSLLRVLLGLQGHSYLTGCACTKLFMSPLSPILEPLLAGMKRKNGGKEKKPHRPLYFCSVF